MKVDLNSVTGNPFHEKKVVFDLYKFAAFTKMIPGDRAMKILLQILSVKSQPVFWYQQ